MQNKKRKICVVTGSRAEYGLLYYLMREIENDNTLILQIIVTGSHLESKFGYTYNQIKSDGFIINDKVDIQLRFDTDVGITNSAGLGVIGFGKVLNKNKPDILVVLGDRFEILSAVIAAMLSRIPVAHIHGGEVTEGAYDDFIRHAITKMSYLHFVSHEKYAKRIIQMGEIPKHIYNYGAPGIDAIKKIKLLNKEELEKDLGINLSGIVAVTTFHPVTMEKSSSKKHIENLLKAIEMSGIKSIFTMPNADSENNYIYKAIEKYVKQNNKVAKAFASLGQLRYLSLLKYCSIMIGNSSSGIIESSSFKLPVVNIGNRQKGRISPGNVINCSEDTGSIVKAIRCALSPVFKKKIENIKNPFGAGNTSKKIKKVLKEIRINNIKKEFVDLM